MFAQIYDFKTSVFGQPILAKCMFATDAHVSKFFTRINIFEQFARCHAKQFSMRHVTNF